MSRWSDDPLALSSSRHGHHSTTEYAIEVSGLHKSFGKVHALRGIDLNGPRGSVLGMLGPNGAGKTTAVRVLTTLLRPGRWAGSPSRATTWFATPPRCARCIGLAGQSTAIQLELTGRENLEIMGRLNHMERRKIRGRAAELLERFDIAEAADRPAKTYSGGMQRRLDLAASLIAEPSVLFLDEPTTGLDPHGRLGMWDIIRELVGRGTTLLLTTQYLDEADELANTIVVVDRGEVIASGTPNQLKNQVGGDLLEFTVPDRTRLDDAVHAVAGLSDAAPSVETDAKRVKVAVGSRGSTALVEAVRRLDAAGMETENLALHRPSLDDVFLAVTGHAAEASSDGTARRLQQPHRRECPHDRSRRQPHTRGRARGRGRWRAGRSAMRWS